MKIGRDTRLHAVGPDGDAVCMVFYDMKTGRGFRDARLIAATPDMLEALENAREYVERKAEDAFSDREDRLLAAIDAAIAKATGTA